MPSLVSRLVVAAAVTLAWAAPAHAVWEAPLMIDQTSEGFGNSGAGDVAVGNNGLATILFLQNDDAGARIWATRRATDAAGWLTPPKSGATDFTGGFTIEAAPDGATAGAWRFAQDGEGPPVPPPPDVQNLIGLGWPADATDAGPKTADLDDQGDTGLPPIDTDGNGFGWTAFIDGDNNLFIVRFSLANPGAAPQRWKVDAVTEDPGSFSGDKTESRENPQIDVNAAGDVIVSFVEARRLLNQGGFSAPVDAVYAVRKLNGKDPGEAFRMSHTDESEAVTEHDPAIADNADVTVLFAADPARNTQEPNTSGPERVYARRWLGTSTGPRNPPGGIELVSSSDENALDVSRLRAEAGPDGRVTAAWSQGNAQLNSAERFGTWTLPETISNNTAAFDIAVDQAGVATAVYRENTVVRARRRSPSQKFAAAEAISTAAVPTDFTPKVDSGKENQADAYIVQAVGTRRGAFATRFTGAAPVEEQAPVKPDTEDCPGDIDVLAGDAGANSIAGVDGRETIMGGDGDDTLSGGGGDDCIRGQGGNDTASGGTGNDNVAGGDGDDRVAGDDGTDLVSGNSGDDRVNGNAGDDTSVAGGDGNDTVDGSDGNDTLNGELGDDKVRGGAGNDTLGGADGNDSLFGNAGTNTLFGGIGNDRLFGGPQNDTLLGEDGDDIVSGGAGPDNLNGGLGNDRLRGGDGKNTLDGAEGNDGIRGGAQADRGLGSAGIDALFGLGGNDTLGGGAASDMVFGGGGRDGLSGDAGKDRLRGGKGADRLTGGAGGDNLNGEGGRDRVFGGAGNDKIGAADGKPDRINCGAGKKDRVVMDDTDVVHRSCEKVRRKKS